jgi:hypothetical protein
MVTKIFDIKDVFIGRTIKDVKTSTNGWTFYFTDGSYTIIDSGFTIINFINNQIKVGDIVYGRIQGKGIVQKVSLGNFNGEIYPITSVLVKWDNNDRVEWAPICYLLLNNLLVFI